MPVCVNITCITNHYMYQALSTLNNNYYTQAIVIDEVTQWFIISKTKINLTHVHVEVTSNDCSIQCVRVF